MPRRPVIALVTLLLVAAACTGGSDTGDTPPSSDDATADTRSPGAATQGPAPTGCGSDDRPCSPDDVDGDVALRVDAVYDELGALLSEGGDTDDLLAWLQEQPDVLEAGAGPEAVRFHVAGALPSWLFVETSLTELSAPPATAETGLAVAAPGPLPSITVDRDSEEKSALVLSPYDWQWSYQGIDGGVAAHQRTLDRVRDYQGRVITLADRLDGSLIRREVPLAAWETFDDHDYVHVLTHGGFYCANAPRPLDPDDCQDRRVGLATMSTVDELVAAFGQAGDGEQDSPSDAVLRSGGFETGRVAIAPRRGEPDTDQLPNTADPFPYTDGFDVPLVYGAGPFVVLTADYFRAAYPEGLTDTVVLLTSCSAGGDSDVQRTLAGPDSAVFGWSRPVRDTVGIATAQRVLELLVERDEEGGDAAGGFRAATVLERLVAEVDAGAPNAVADAVVEAGAFTDPARGAQLGVVGDDDARAREVPYLLDHEGDELRSGGVVEVVGQPGDGEPDRLELTIEVDGLDDDVDAATVPLSVQVDEAAFYDVTQRLTQPVGRSLWRTGFGLDLDRDLAPESRLELRVEAQLPDGSFSAWTYEDLRPCGVTPDGNRIPFPLPDGAVYVGPVELASVHRYTVPSYDAALAHLEAAVAADPDHTQIDDPRLSRVGDVRDAGFTLVGPCYDLAGGFSLQEQQDGSVTVDVLDLG